MHYKKQWSKKEQELREQMKREQDASKKSYTELQPVPKTSPVFSSRAASAILMNDLLIIMEKSHHLVNFSIFEPEQLILFFVWV